jgi:CBS domain-containing protein
MHRSKVETMYTVAEIMTRDLVTLREGDTLDSADRYLELGHIRHLPVVRGRKIVGLVTHRDLLRYSLRREPRTGADVVARDVMTRDLTTVRPETSLLEAIRIMLTNKFGCLPVTTEDGALLGIITESDLLRVAAQRAEEIDFREAATEYND